MKIGETRGPLTVSRESFNRYKRARGKAALQVARLGYRLVLATGDPEEIERALNAIKQAEYDHRDDTDTEAP